MTRALLLLLIAANLICFICRDALRYSIKKTFPGFGTGLCCIF